MSPASLRVPALPNGPVDVALMSSLSALEAALERLETAPQLEAAVALGEDRRSLGDALAGLDRRDAQGAAAARALQAVVRLSNCGALDLPQTEADRERLTRWAPLGWPGLLASMLVTASWRWNAAPGLAMVPDWMWGPYCHWLYAAPNLLITSEDGARYALHLDRHSEELARWAQRNAGSSAVRAAVDAYLRHAPLHPLRWVDSRARLAAESRGRILARVAGRALAPFEPPVTPRRGRPLRVGLMARQWDLDPHTGAALGYFEQLPADRIERVLVSTREPVTAFGWHCRDQAQEFHLLPPDMAGQVTMLRDLSLDVAVFVDDLTAGDDFSQLAAFRVAPLQIVRDFAPGNPGVPATDLEVLPASAARAGGTERFAGGVALLPEGAMTFALRRGGDAELAYAREDLGFEADAVVLVTVLPSMHAVGEKLGLFARILAGAPGTRLVLHVRPDPQLRTIGKERFCAVVEAVMRQAEVPLDHVTLLAPECATYDESRAIVRLADIYLGVGGMPVWGAEALSSGIPVVALEGVEAEWLRADQAADLVAENAEAFVPIVVSLAGDAKRRAALKHRLERTAASGSSCTDTLAGGDGFLGLVERAFDRLEAMGRAAFQRQAGALLTVGGDEDVNAATVEATEALANGDPAMAVDATQRALGLRPRDGRIRALHGRALLADGRCDRATTYLLAAVESLNEDPDVWFDLATSLRHEGKHPEATQALESALRLRPERAEGWLMLIELAESAGAYDLAGEAVRALQTVAPQHPRLAELAMRLGS